MEISQIKQDLSILTVLEHYGLQVNKNKMLRCPFHGDKTPSMQVYPQSGTVFCFSSNCKLNGKAIDQVDFILHKDGCSKHEAIIKAQSLLTGAPAKTKRPQASSETAPVVPLERIAVLTKVYGQSRESILRSPKAATYCKKRHLANNKDMGFLPERFYHGWNKELTKSALDLGLLQSMPNKNLTSGFKNCLLFALKNKAGQVVDLYGRSTTEPSSSPGQADNTGKHYYLKGKHEGLYPAYPKAETKQLILTESIIDAATLIQLKVESKKLKAYEVLACYGTNGLTEEHKAAINELQHLQEVIFFFDGDAAGEKAVEKYAKQLKIDNGQLTISKVNTPQGEDVNSLLDGHDKEVLTELLDSRTTLIFSSTEESSVEEKSNDLPLTTNDLNTNNPDYITYQKGHLKFTLLGGMSLQQADRLRVTVKLNIEPQLSALQSIRHNIDLYNDDQVEKFSRKAAEKLETGTTQVLQALGELTEKLEQYRQSKIESQKKREPKVRTLTAERRKAALDYLKKDKLLQRTNADIAQSGVIGEETNRLLMYIVFTSRLREQPLHIISLGASGSGKTYLQEKIAELIPEQDKLEITILSDNAFYYFDQKELQQKLVLIEDMDGAENVLYPLRELMSKKRISKRVVIKDSKGNLRTVNLQVEGPICMAGTTTKENIYEDNANRSILLYLDGSREHQDKIMDYQRALSAGQIDTSKEDETRELFKDMQTLLKPVKVRNPYATKLKIPEEVFKPLRTNTHYLQFIECITFYHQYQRELKTDRQTGERYIETTLEDIAAANVLLKEVLLAKSDELSGACRRFFENLKHYLQSQQEAGADLPPSFYAKEVRSNMRMSYPTLKRYLLQLTRNGYLKIIAGDRFKKGYEYEVVSYEEYKALQRNIKTALDTALERIKKEESKTVSGSVAHSGSVDLVSH